MNIAVIGSAGWVKTLDTPLRKLNTMPLHLRGREGYVAALADAHAALILIEAEDPGWEFWAVTPKASPATRRIPVVVVTGEEAAAAQARKGGADEVVDPAELLDRLPDLVANLARVTDQQMARELIDECAEPLPEMAQEAIARFNAGDYYAQHDLFEALWMEETRPIRDLYRAILQIGIAYYQIERGNWRGAHKMLLRCLQWLALLPDNCQGVNIARLRADAAAVRAELERIGSQENATFDRSLLKGVEWKGMKPK